MIDDKDRIMQENFPIQGRSSEGVTYFKERKRSEQAFSPFGKHRGPAHTIRGAGNIEEDQRGAHVLRRLGS